MSQRTHSNADTNEATKPTAKNKGSAWASNARSFHAEYAPAAMSVGTARKNENSVAALRERPKSIPPMIVAPDRDVPGIRAKAWAMPTLSASSAFMSSTSAMRGTAARARCLRSTHRITNAPAMKASATGTGWKSDALIALPSSSPSTAAGRKAIAMLRMKRCAARSLSAPARTRAKRARYSHTMASIAPDWIAISKTLASSPT